MFIFIGILLILTIISWAAGRLCTDMPYKKSAFASILHLFFVISVLELMALTHSLAFVLTITYVAIYSIGEDWEQWKINIGGYIDYLADTIADIIVPEDITNNLDKTIDKNDTI